MEAGRELDVLVAEKVMGISVWRAPEIGPIARTGRTFEYKDVPPYSIDIAAAMTVVDHIWKQGIPNPFRGLFDEPISAQEMALKICLAALKAMGG